MGLRSNFEVKRPRDYWPTCDPDAITNLIPFVKGRTYAEPCCGDGSLVALLADVSTCKWESDIEPQAGQLQKDALELTKEDLKDCELIITNPPFNFKMLQLLLDYLPTLKPVWLLLPATFMQNKRSGPYLRACTRVVAVGRLYWMDNGIKGKDDYCWYFFPQGGNASGYPTKFISR
jgi:hypothetical protein